MSEQVQAAEHAAEVHPPAAGAVAVPAVPFTERQIEQFDADDGDAGRALGKMLATFFLYTVIVMLGVGWWTFRRANAVKAEAAQATHAAVEEGTSGHAAE